MKKKGLLDFFLALLMVECLEKASIIIRLDLYEDFYVGICQTDAMSSSISWKIKNTHLNKEKPR